MMRQRFSRIRLWVAGSGLALIVAGAIGIGAAAPAMAVGVVHAEIRGSGSTWSANALQAWMRNVWATSQWKISYTESGSTSGRNDFKNGTADFGVSEIPYNIANSNEVDPAPDRGYAYMPVVAGGTAFMYNLQIGGRMVTNLRLGDETLAKIFTGAITRWDDPQIQADNPQLSLPGIQIVPVVRSDGSGATAQFTIWMRQQHPAIWDAYCQQAGRPMVNGHCGVTSNYPVVPGSGFISRSGSNGVSSYVAQGAAVGAITFVEYSYARNSGFPVAKMLNSAGYYVEPTAYSVAVALLSAQINQDTTSPNYLTQDLTNVYTSADPRSYPMSSYSYIILPTSLGYNFSEDKGLTLADFGTYFLCEGQQSADALGYSPLPVNLVKAGQQQIKKVPGGNPSITDVAGCNNPTLDPNDPNGNALATKAPFPADCDRVGQVQCATGTGGAVDQPTALNGPAGAGGDGTAAGADGSGGGLTGGLSESLAGGLASGAAVMATATPQIIDPRRFIGVPLAALAAGGLLVVAALLPPMLSARGTRPALKVGAVQ